MAVVHINRVPLLGLQSHFGDKVLESEVPLSAVTPRIKCGEPQIHPTQVRLPHSSAIGAVRKRLPHSGGTRLALAVTWYGGGGEQRSAQQTDASV